MPTKTYRFRYSGENKEFEVEGDRAFVVAMIKRYGPDAPQTPPPFAGETTKGKAAKNLPLAKQPAAKDVSLREFIQRLSLKKHTDIVLAFGYFLEKYRGNETFTSTDINSCYYESKLESSNSSQMIVNNIKTGRMMEAKAKGKERKGRGRSYTLTSSGEAYIAEKLAPAQT